MITRAEPARGGQRALASPVRQLMAAGIAWRVLVEAWPGRDGWAGRLVFTPSAPNPHFTTRHGPVGLVGTTLEDVLNLAHEIEEGRLRALLHSLG